ncbi:hypothetical protein [Desulfobacter latus]|uniref:Lipoprotein n=1 Tax=Desulfobacter latus TaxID=2292 RepID=A0A850T3H7_9BACT|nr:hypothetical protein [Desulfobacter latus]NWH06920.1 hypothetical protein [Desulfobacter latus]
MNKINNGIFIFIVCFLLLFCGCDSEKKYRKGKETGYSIGYDEGKYVSTNEARKEASKEYFEYGYEQGLTKIIEEGDYEFVAYKCILVIILFCILGILAYYYLFLFLRKERHIDDIDALLVPDMNNFDFSKISDSELSELMHHSIDKLGYIVKQKMIPYEDTTKE